MTEKVFLQQLFLLKCDIEAHPLLDRVTAEIRNQWTRRFADLLARRASGLAGGCDPWEVLCPDCDHGVRGGSPCGTCGGRGLVRVVLAPPSSRPHEIHTESTPARPAEGEHP